MRTMNIGTVSHGTMRLEEDLIPAFIDALKSQKPLRREHRKLINDIQEGCGCGDEADLEKLFEALNEYAPPYFYFGAHQGDGSDYGFWLSNFFEEDFEGIKVNDLSEVPRGFTGEVLYVNDHGNMTLYRYSHGRSWETWSLV